MLYQSALRPGGCFGLVDCLSTFFSSSPSPAHFPFPASPSPVFSFSVSPSALLIFLFSPPHSPPQTRSISLHNQVYKAGLQIIKLSRQKPLFLLALYEFDSFTLLEKHLPLLPHSLSLLPKGVWIILSEPNTMTEYRCYFDDCLCLVLQCYPTRVKCPGQRRNFWTIQPSLTYSLPQKLEGVSREHFWHKREQDYYNM